MTSRNGSFSCLYSLVNSSLICSHCSLSLRSLLNCLAAWRRWFSGVIRAAGGLARWLGAAAATFIASLPVIVVARDKKEEYGLLKRWTLEL